MSSAFPAFEKKRRNKTQRFLFLKAFFSISAVDFSATASNVFNCYNLNQGHYIAQSLLHCVVMDVVLLKRFTSDDQRHLQTTMGSRTRAQSRTHWGRTVNLPFVTDLTVTLQRTNSKQVFLIRNICIYLLICATYLISICCY